MAQNLTYAQVEAFVLYNQTQAKLIMKDVFCMNIEPLKEKLDDKIKKLNSSRVIKKITKI